MLRVEGRRTKGGGGKLRSGVGMGSREEDMWKERNSGNHSFKKSGRNRNDKNEIIDLYE